MRQVVWPGRTSGPGWLVAPRHDAAVNVPDGAGDPAGGWRQQEGDGVGQVAGGTDAAERVEAVEAVQGLVELVLRDETLVDRGRDHRWGDRVDPDVVGGQLDGQDRGKRVQPALAHRVPRRRGDRDALVGPHAADVDDRAAAAVLDHASDDGLGNKERGPVQFEVRVVVAAVVVHEGLGDEEPGRVDQQRGVGVFTGQLLADAVHLRAVGQVRGDAVGGTFFGQCLDGVVDPAGVIADDDGAAAGGYDVFGSLAAHSAAAADDHQLLPGEDGHGHRPAGLLHVVVPALEPIHAHFRTFLSTGCAGVGLLFAH